MKRAHNGYTLVELLVVLALMALISLAMSGGIRFGARAWEKSGAQVEAMENLETTQALLRTLLQRIIPRDLDPGIPGDPDLFRGRRDKVSFTALTPSAIDRSGMARFELAVIEHQGQKKLRLSWSGMAGPAQPQTRILMTGASDISFAFATLDQTGVLVWREDWLDQSGAPALIRVRAKLPAGATFQWPDLMVRPRISREPSCIYDPVSFSCRHA